MQILRVIRGILETAATWAVVWAPVSLLPLAARQTQSTATAGDTSSVVTKRLLANLTFNTAGEHAPLPDGKRFAMVNLETGDLAIKDITTGAVRLLTHNARPWEGFTHATPRVSHDGKRIVYNWQPSDTIWSLDVRVSNVDDGSTRTLVKATQAYTVPMDWSRDGRSVLAWRQREDGTTQIVLISTGSENSVRVLKTLEWREPLGMNFSPDGRYIVYDTPPRQDSNARDIYILATDGSRETRVVEGAANDYVLGWAPGGRHILFASDRSGVPSAWLLEVDGGRARGKPVLVKSGMWRMLPGHFTADGSYYYGVRTGGRDLFVVPFDPATQKSVGVPTPITHSELALSARSDWSPDGRMIAYTIERGQSLPPIIAIYSVESGEVREIPLPPRLKYVSGMRWQADSKGLLMRGNDRGHGGLLQLDLQSAAIREILGHGTSSLDVVPGANAIVYLAGDESQILVRNLTDGTERLLYRVDKGSVFPQILAVSPDGKTLAFFRRTGDYRAPRELMTIPLQGGEPQRVAILEQTPASTTTLRWSKDGRSLLFSSMKGETPPMTGLWSVPATGGTPAHTGVKGVFLRHLALSPDGRRLNYMAGVGESELWVMQRFLPR